MPRFPALVLVTQGVLLLAACGPAAESPDAEERAHRVDPIRLAPCESEDGPAEDLLLGSLEVPEDWSRPGGRSISLGITVLPARQRAAAPPLYHLVGGPGNDTSVWSAIYTGAVPWPIGQEAPRVRGTRDIVLVDHRGTGRSNALHCPALDAFHRIEPAFPIQEVAACRDRLSEGADLTQYAAPSAVRDLEAAREGLGHAEIDLYGSSYGTSLALAYLRSYPERVRGVVLVGTLPLDNRVPLEHAVNAERVFDRLLSDCAADPACAGAFPNLEARWHALLERLEDDPVEVRVTGPDDTARLVPVGRGALVESLRSLLAFHVQQREVPWLIHESAEGNFAPLVGRVTGSADASFAMGLYLSAQCPATLRARGEIEEATAGTALGDYRIRAQLAACEAWPRADLPDDWLEPVVAETPVLLITGELDHETPAAWAETVAEHLPRSRRIVVPNMGHVMLDVEQSCYWEVVLRFLEDPDPEALDAGCLAENQPVPWRLAGEENPGSE